MVNMCSLVTYVYNVEKWEQSICPTGEQRIGKPWWIHMMGYLKVTKIQVENKHPLTREDIHVKEADDTVLECHPRQSVKVVISA